MSTHRRYTLWIDETHAAALKALKGTPGEEPNQGVQVRQEDPMSPKAANLIYDLLADIDAADERGT